MDEHHQREWVQDFGRRPLYEYNVPTDKRRYFPLFVATCSGKQPYRIGGEGEGGVKKTRGLLVTLSDGDALVYLALSPPCRRGLSLLVLGLTGPQGLSLDAIPATRLPSLVRSVGPGASAELERILLFPSPFFATLLHFFLHCREWMGYCGQIYLPPGLPACLPACQRHLCQFSSLSPFRVM